MSEWVTTCNERPEWLSRDEDDDASARWCLTLVWSAAEPERIGETAVVDEQLGQLVLGRGGASAADPSERLQFVRQRPGGVVPRPPLQGDGLSRRQCLVQANARGITLENIGRAAMLIDSQQSASATVGEGQLVTIKDQLVLYCSRQPPPVRLRYFDLKRAVRFGDSDAFGIVGEHRAIWELREQLAFSAASNQHVLVVGESGSGKELAAKALHQLSPRGKRDLVARNAATFPSTLIDAELFGSAANYPNSGMPARAGVIGQADGTTLYLDEIAELPAELQSHLLRVLDRGGEYQRLGDAQVRHSDFRLVAATNRDPTELRLDLLGRFTLQIQLPSLGDRVEDIPLLVRHLLLRAAESSPGMRARFFVETQDGAHPRIDPDLIEALMRHRFTYNVRELDRLLWKAVADSPRNFVALTRALRDELGEPERSASPPPALAAEPTADEVKAALDRCDGHVAKAAGVLRLSSRYALYRLMRKYGLKVERG